MATIAKLVVSLNLDDKAFKKGISAVPKMVQAAQKGVAAAAEKTAKATQKAEAGIKKVQVAAQQAATKIADPISAAADGFAKLGNNFNAKSIEVPKGGFITALRDIEKQYKTTQAAAQKTVTANAAAGKSFAAIKDPVSQAAQSFSQIGNIFGQSGGGIRGAISSIATTVKSGLSSAFSSVGPLAAKAGAAIKAGIGMAVSAVGAAVGAIAAGAAAIGGAFALITAGAFSLAKSAAPVQGIRSAFAGLASTVEGGSQAMLTALQKASMGMVTNTDLMRQFNLASQLVGVEFATALPQAFTYLGKVASATGQDMGFLMNSLTVGIGRLSPLILDNLGVQVDLTQAYADFAEENGLVAASLTKTQQQAALTAQVMQKLEENTANIPTTFGSASQVFAAFGAELQNIKDDVGMDLLPTFTSLFQTFQKFLPAIRAIGQGFAGTFAAIVNVAKSFVKGLLSAMGVDFNNLADNAGSWGENIVMQLASGMARAIGAVLSVLNSLGQAIAGWLAPGSPPKLLPELPAWGENAANWFLKGMTNANMNILRDLSGQVEGFMRSIMPKASTQEMAKAVLEIRQNMEKALSGGGNLLNTLPKELRGYAQAMLQAEAASKKLKAANEFLVKTQEKYNNLLKPLNAELEAISRRQQEVANDMRKAELDSMEARARASGDTLALELIALERRQLELEGQKTAVEDEAKTAIDTAGEKVTAAQAEQDAAAARLELEQQLLQHQIETNNLLADTIEKLEASGGAAGGAAGGVGGLADALENLGGAGAGFGGVGASISALAQQIIDQFKPVEKQAQTLGQTWGDVFTGITNNVGKFLDWFAGAVLVWEGNITNIKEIWRIGKENIVELWDNLQLTIDAFGEHITTVVIPTWQGNVDQMGMIWQLGKANIAELWEGLKLTILAFADWFKNDVVQTWSSNIGQLETIWSLAKKTIGRKWDELKTEIENAFSPIQDTLDNFSTGIGNVITSIQGLITWVGNLATALANFDLGALTALLAQSPPPLAVGIKWVGSELDRFSRGNLNRLGRGIDRLPAWPEMGGTPSIGLSGAAAGAVMGGSFGMGSTDRASSPSVTVPITGTVINNGMDMAVFESRVKKVVVGALRNRP